MLESWLEKPARIREELRVERMISQDMTKRGIPDELHGGLVRYVVHRIPPGHFLTALLSNDLLGTINRADGLNVSLIKAWVMVLYNCKEIPSGCWGSKENVQAWLSGRQLNQDEIVQIFSEMSKRGGSTAEDRWIAEEERDAKVEMAKATEDEVQALIDLVDNDDA